MIAPIREADPPPQTESRATHEVRRLLASLFLEEKDERDRPVPAVSQWKAWLLIVWAVAITLAYFAAMLDLI